MAVSGAQQEMVTLLLSSGASPGAAQAQGYTAVHLAALRGDLGTLQLLLATAAPSLVSAVAKDGKGSLPAVHTLLAAGADVAGRDQQRWTALHAAAAGDHAPVISRLAQAGASLGDTTRTGQLTALHLAAQHGRQSAVVALLTSGASPSVVDSDDWMPLHLTARAGDAEVVSLLQQAGAAIDAPGGANAWTPLYCAAAANSPAVMEVLLAAGAAVEICDKHGLTPLSLARDKGHGEVAATLESKLLQSRQHKMRQVLGEVPDEVIGKVLGYLDTTKDRIRGSLVNRQWRAQAFRCGRQLWGDADIAVPPWRSHADVGCILWLLRLARADALCRLRICFPGTSDAAGTAAVLAALNPSRSLHTLRLRFVGRDRGSGLGVGLAGLSHLGCLEIESQLPLHRWEVSRIGQCLPGLTRLRVTVVDAMLGRHSGEASYHQLPEELGSLPALQHLELSIGAQQYLEFPSWVTNLKSLARLTLESIGYQTAASPAALSADIASLSALAGLTSLHLGFRRQYTDVLQEGIPQLSHLRCLRLTGLSGFDTWAITQPTTRAGLSLLQLPSLQRAVFRTCGTLTEVPGSMQQLAARRDMQAILQREELKGFPWS
ncbi:hypothetical protein N2152v2_003323 [Parachlorella kessleri]